jgi:hypothetical protein
MRFFLVAEILLLCAAFVMLTVWMTLLRYPARLSSPASWLFVHVPVRMFLLFLINLAIWQNGLIALGWFKYNGSDPDQKPGRWEKEHETHAWIAFGVITGLGLIDSFIVFLGKDLAWAGATIFLFISILLHSEKPVQVVVRSHTLVDMRRKEADSKCHSHTGPPHPRSQSAGSRSDRFIRLGDVRGPKERCYPPPRG